MEPIPDICVVGTDTGVGKTVVSLLIMQWLLGRGHDPFYLKPFQTGCIDPYDTDSDAAFVYRHTASLRQQDAARSVIHCFPSPKAPYFAARDAGQHFDMETVRQTIEEKRAVHSPLVVEAAGGLLVPVAKKETVIDLLSQISCRPLLVARTALGTINHTLLSIEAMERRKVPPLAVVLVQPPGSADDPDLVRENVEAIESFSGVPVGGVIPPILDFNTPLSDAYLPLEKIWGGTAIRL